MRQIVACFIVVSMCCSAGATDRFVPKKYPIYASDVFAVLEVARAFVGENGRVVHDKVGGQMLVVTTVQIHGELALALAQVNIVPRNVRIDVKIMQVEAASDHRAGVKISGGTRVGQSGAGVRCSIRGELVGRTALHSSSAQQSVTVISGKGASIEVSREVPFASWILAFGRDSGYILKKVEVKLVGAFLRIEPNVIGNGPMIRVKLTPEIRALVGGKMRRIQYVNLATEVLATNGKSIRIGGAAGSSPFYDKFLVRVDRDRIQRLVTVSMTPTILNQRRQPTRRRR